MKDSQIIISGLLLVGIIAVVTFVSMDALPDKLEIKQATTPQPTNSTTEQTPVPTVTVPATPYTTPTSPTNPQTTLPPLTPIPTPVLPPPNYPTPNTNTPID